jgi:hypothetical protein
VFLHRFCTEPTRRLGASQAELIELARRSSWGMDSKFGSLSVAFFERLRGHMLTLPQRRMSISLRLAYFARTVASFASYSRALFGQNEIVAGSSWTRRSWAKIAECHKGKRK